MLRISTIPLRGNAALAWLAGLNASHGFLPVASPECACYSQAHSPTTALPNSQRADEGPATPSTSKTSSSPDAGPTEFNYRPGPSSKLPYAIMRNVLHNKEVYLEDAKLARFLTARRANQLYGLKLDASRTLSMLLGNVTRRTLIRMYQRSQRISLADRRWRLVMAVESRMDMMVLRMGLCENIRVARDYVRHGRLTLNGAPVNLGNIAIRPGDVLSVQSKHKAFVQDRIADSIADLSHEIKHPATAVYYMPPHSRLQLSSEQLGRRAEPVRLRLGIVARNMLRYREREKGNQESPKLDLSSTVVAEATTPASPLFANRWERTDRDNPFRRWDKTQLAKSLEDRQKLTMHKLLALYNGTAAATSSRRSAGVQL